MFAICSIWGKLESVRAKPARQRPNPDSKNKVARRPVSRVLSPRPDEPGAGDGHSSGTPVAGRLVRPTRAAARNHPPARSRPAAPIRSCSRWGLPCRPRYRERGALLPHPFTLTRGPMGRAGGLLSVALSLGSPPPGVTRHRVSVEPGLSSPRRVAPLPGGGHPAVWHPKNGDFRRSSQPSWAISQPSRAAVPPSIPPSTRDGRKWRWKAARTIRVSSSSTPEFGTP